MQGAAFAQRLFGVLARRDVAQNAGKVALAAQRHFADGYLQWKPAAVLAQAHDLATHADSAGRVADAIVVQRYVVLVLVQLRNEQSESFAREFRCAVAKHVRHGRVDRLNDAAARVQGHNAVDDCIENRLHQRRAVAQRLLGDIFVGHVAKHQYRAHHRTGSITNGRTAVGNVEFAVVARDQHGMVGQALNRAVRQRIGNRNGGGFAAVLVDDGKDLVDGSAQRLGMGPTGHILCHRIE